MHPLLQILPTHGLGKGRAWDDYMNWLDVWRNNTKMSLLTWAEISPEGKIAVDYKLHYNKRKIQVSVSQKTSGIFVGHIKFIC